MLLGRAKQRLDMDASSMPADPLYLGASTERRLSHSRGTFWQNKKMEWRFFISPGWIFFFFFELFHEIVAHSEIKQWFALEGIWDILDAELLRLFD